MQSRMKWNVLVWVLGLAPFTYIVILVVRLQMGEWDVLGNEPGREIVFFTGEWAFNFLLLTLVASTFRRQLSFSSLIPQRRKLGLFCFFYAMLHGLAFAGFLLEWQWQEIVEELIERQYLTFGMLALVILIPLALTSTKGWQKRLGQRWKSLHKAVYLIAILVAIHYLLQIRSNWFWPTLYAVITGLLLLERLIIVSGKSKRINKRK